MHWSPQLSWKRLPLSVKMALAMTVLVVMVVGVISLLSIRREQDSFRNELQAQASLLLDFTQSASSDALYTLDAAYLRDLIAQSDELGGGRDVPTEIYDRDGRLIADSQGMAVFTLEPAAYSTRLLAGNSTTVFDWGEDDLTAGRVVVVGREKIGVIKISLSTAPLDEKMAIVRNRGITIAVLAVVTGAALAYLLSQTITGPMRELTEATKRLAADQLKQDLVAAKGDEITALQGTFNAMSARLTQTLNHLNQRNHDLEIANEAALQASRLKTEFLATVSHELRTPLNAIIGFSDMLLMGMSGPLNEKQHHKVGRLQENGRRLLALVNDILDVARIESGRMELVREPFSPQRLIDQVSAQTRVLAENKKLEFKTNLDAELPPLLIGDEKRIEQVVINLLSNAFKFTEQGAVTLKISSDSDTQTWSLAVTDTGIGIPAHALDVIFEQFRQVDNSSTRIYQGAGLGLAITRHLVQMMDGKIKVESTVGAGSTFTVTLPMVIPEPTPAILV